MFNICTTLGLQPAPSNSCPFITIIRGGSAELLFDLSEYSYLMTDDTEWDKDIDQITFLFKQMDEIKYYKMFIDETQPHTDKNIDKHFRYEADINQISFMLNPNETSEFEPAEADDPILFEVAIKANTDTLMKEDSVIIEPQNSILVRDSLYCESGLSTQEGVAVKCRTK